LRELVAAATIGTMRASAIGRGGRWWGLIATIVLGLGYGCALIAGVQDGELSSTVHAGGGGAGTSSGAGPVGGGGTTSVGGSGVGGSGVGGSGTGASGTGGSVPVYHDLVVSDGAVAFWRLGEDVGPNATDSSGNDHHGIYNGASITLGEPGALVGDPDTAAHFAGTTSGFVEMGDVLDFTARAAFSIELWAKPDQADGAVAGKLAYDDTNGYRGYAISIPTDPVVFYFRRNGLRASAPLSVPAADYAHVVGTYDGYVIRLYVDGTLVDSEDSIEEVDDIAASFIIGEAANWGRYDGAVDEVAVYDYQLTPAQIGSHLRAGLRR
jgi:hypothetical protein